MVKRDKRIKKSIESLKEQKEIHEKKKEMAKELGQEELVEYYEKEIQSLEERKKERENKLDRKK